MSKYSIPSQLKIGFSLIASLNEVQLNTVNFVFENAEFGEGIKTLSERLNSKSDLGEQNSIEIIRSLFSMVNIFKDAETPKEEFIKDFTDSMETEIGVKNKELENVRNNLLNLLSNSQKISKTIKAKNLIVENANNFMEGRIVSDIRISYDEDLGAEKKEQFGVIVHNLRLTYCDTHGDNERTFYISLDLKDLNSLKKIVDRALKKDELMRSNQHEINFINLSI